MKTRRGSFALILALMAGACDGFAGPDTTVSGVLDEPGVSAVASAAVGEFVQTSITSIDVQVRGSNTIINQTSEGVMTGTIQGTYQDQLHVVVRENGGFNTNFKITCQCEVDGKSGTLEFTATDIGEMTGPASASFSGRAVITGGSGELAGMHGSLDIEGTVDLQSGLSRYDYSGTIRQTGAGS